MTRLILCLWFLVRLAAASEISPATLEIKGEPLFVFRARVGSVQPIDRVRLIAERIARLEHDPLFDPAKIEAREEAQVGWEVVSGEHLILVITSEDARLENRPAKLIALGLATRISEILVADRIAKSPAVLLRHSLYAVGYLLGLLLILWAIALIYRRIDSFLTRSQGTRIRSISLKGFDLVKAERITFVARGAVRVLRLVLTVSLLYFFLPLVLRLFPWTARLSPVLIGYVLNPLRQIGHSIVTFIPNLFVIVLNILVARYFLKFVRLLFDEIENGNVRFTNFYPEWAKPTYQLLRVLVITFTFIIIFPYIPGSGSAAFQGVSVFIGVLVSLGSTSAVANAVAGIVLTYMRSFRTGDRVKIADSVGDIVEKTLLVTRIRTVKNVDVTIPNSLVLNSHIVNYSSLAASDGLILNTEVTIGYDAPWVKVHQLLIEAALKTKGILATPAPFVLQVALEDSYVRYQLNAYTRLANQMSHLYSELHSRVQDAFNSAGVEIMSPSYQSLRDGNTVTIPAKDRPADYQAPSFRVTSPSDPLDLPPSK